VQCFDGGLRLGAAQRKSVQRPTLVAGNDSSPGVKCHADPRTLFGFWARCRPTRREKPCGSSKMSAAGSSAQAHHVNFQRRRAQFPASWRRLQARQTRRPGWFAACGSHGRSWRAESWKQFTEARAWADEPAADILELPQGFSRRVGLQLPKAEQGSWVSMTFEPQGRIIASDQGGPLYRLTLRGAEAQPAVKKHCTARRTARHSAG